LKRDGINGARGVQASGRISFKDAAAAGRAAWAKAMTAEIPTPKGTRPLNCTELRVLGVVRSFTESWSKLSDYRGVEQIAEIAARNPRTIARALKVLATAGIITYVPGDGHGHVSIIGLPPAPEKGSPPEPFVAEEGWTSNGSVPMERGTSNSPPFGAQRGTSNSPPSDRKGGLLGPEKVDDLGPKRWTTNSPPREEKYLSRGEILFPTRARAREDEEEEPTISKNEHPEGAVAKERVTTPFTDPDHALAGLSLDGVVGPSPARAESPLATNPESGRPVSPEVDAVRTHLTALGYKSSVVAETIRRLHDDVRNPEAWAESIAPELEREQAAVEQRVAVIEAETRAVLDGYRDHERRVAEEREGGFKPPDWREVVPA
jgi:hypothetical protein